MAAWPSRWFTTTILAGNWGIIVKKYQPKFKFFAVSIALCAILGMGCVGEAKNISYNEEFSLSTCICCSSCGIIAIAKSLRTLIAFIAKAVPRRDRRSSGDSLAEGGLTAPCHGCVDQATCRYSRQPYQLRPTLRDWGCTPLRSPLSCFQHGEEQ